MIIFVILALYIIVNVLVNRFYLNDLKGYITYYDASGKRCIDFELLKSNDRIVRSLIFKGIPFFILEFFLMGWFIYELFI